MEKYKIKLRGIDDMKEFSEIVNNFDFSVDIISEDYKIDAKSIMGVLSLDLTKDIIIEAQPADEAAFRSAIEKFIIL